MNSKILAFSILAVLLSFNLSAQKTKTKKADPLTMKVDSLSKRLNESEATNKMLMDQNDKLSSDVAEQREDMTKLNDKIIELAKMIEVQNAEIKKLNDALKAKPTEPKQDNNTSIAFDETVIDFGEVKEGVSVTKVYKFKNTGKKRLLIEGALGSCGCTVAEWPKYPVEPGEKGEVKVVFNSLGKRGAQDKTVTLTANTDPAKTILRIKGTVTPAE
jgi:TolA-binding protein